MNNQPNQAVEVNADNQTNTSMLDFVNGMVKEGFTTILKNSKGIAVKHTIPYDEVVKHLSDTLATEDAVKGARIKHTENTSVISHAILATINTAVEVAGGNKHLRKAMVNANLDNLKEKADISTVEKNEDGSANKRYSSTFKTRASEGISSLKVTTPKQFETLSQFVTRAKFSKKNALEQKAIELKEKISSVGALYTKAGVPQGMKAQKAKAIANLLKPAFKELDEIAVNLQTSIDATAKAKS